MEKIFEKYLQLNHIQRGEIPEDARLMSLAQFKLAAAEIVKNERERIVGVIDERIELCSKTNRNAEKEGLQKIKKTILTTDSEVKNTNKTSEAQNEND